MLLVKLSLYNRILQNDRKKDTESHDELWKSLGSLQYVKARNPVLYRVAHRNKIFSAIPSSNIGAKIQYKCGISSIKYPNVSNFSTCEFTILLKLVYIFIYSYYFT